MSNTNDLKPVRIQMRHPGVSEWSDWDSGVRGDHGYYPLWQAKVYVARIVSNGCEARLVDWITKEVFEP